MDTPRESSASTYVQPGDAQRWRSHPVAAFLIRGFVRIGPILLAFVVATFVGQNFPRSDGALGLAVWVAMVWVVSTATMVVADRMLQALLPLATLLRLSLVFPDEAPSRFRFALRSGTAKELERRIAEGRLGTSAGESARTLLTMLTSLRDHDRMTRGHSERVRAYSMLIGDRMDLSQADRDRLQWGALAHDVGKLAVDPAILSKKGRPTTAEWEELRRHPEAARLLVEPLRPWLGEWVDAATQHHERIDGLGYPAGLAGTDITLAGRIVAVADAFDTMTSTRSYKPALSFDDALAELTRSAGTQFDEEVVRAFLAVPLRRVRLVAGSFGWLGNLPFLGEASVATAGGGAAIGAGSVVVAAAAIATGAVVPSFDFLGEDTREDSVWAADPGEVERRVDDGAPIEFFEDAPAPTGDPTDTDGEPRPTPSEPVTSDSVPSSTDSVPSSTTTADPTTTLPPPDPADDAFAIEEGTVEQFDVLGNDRGANSVLDRSTLEVVDPPDHARSWAVLPSGKVRYHALDLDDEGASPSDSFRYRICDLDGMCAEATVRLTIVPDSD